MHVDICVLHTRPVRYLMVCGADAGMPGPNFPLSNPFWPQMGSGMSGGSQGPRPPLYPGASSNGSFDPVSAAYYANLGNQQMAAAMAAAAVRPVQTLLQPSLHCSHCALLEVCLQQVFV